MSHDSVSTPFETSPHCEALVVAAHGLSVVLAVIGQSVVHEAGGVKKSAPGEPGPHGLRSVEPGGVAMDAVVQLGGQPDVKPVGDGVLVGALGIPPDSATAGAGVPVRSR